jgi:hypothetical protein
MIEKGPFEQEHTGEDSPEKKEYQKIQEIIQAHWLGLAEMRRRYKEGGEPFADEWVESAVQAWFAFQNENRELADKVLTESFDIIDARPLLFGKKEKDREEKRIAARLRKDTLFRDAVEESFMHQTFFTAFGSDEFFAESVSLKELKLMEKLIKTRPNISEKYKQQFIDSLTNGTYLLKKKIDSLNDADAPTDQRRAADNKKYLKMLKDKFALLKEYFPKTVTAGEKKYTANATMHDLFMKRSIDEISEEETAELLSLGEQYPDLFDEAVHMSTFYDQFARGARIHANLEGALEKAVSEINRRPAEMMQKFLSGGMNSFEAFNFFETIRLGENSVRSQELIEEFESYLAEQGVDKKEKQKYGIISGVDLPERVFRWFMKTYMGKPHEDFSLDYDPEDEG